jgi:hypothetical protein
MLSFLFGLEKPYGNWRAFGWYAAHVLVAGLLGAAFGGAAFLAGLSADAIGALAGIIYSSVITVLVIAQRKLEGKYYGLLAVVIPVSAKLLTLT